MNADILFQGQGVTKEFGGLTAVSNVDFQVRKGEILGLIGPNGAGKTTLVNCITGVFPIDSGTMTFKGQLINGFKPHQVTRSGVARTFQIVQPFPNLTVLDNVVMGALFGHTHAENDIHRARDVAREKLEFVGLAGTADRPAAELTLVERKRLELAKSLATNPELLLLDEVNAGLNTHETREAIALIRKFATRGSRSSSSSTSCTSSWDCRIGCSCFTMAKKSRRAIPGRSPATIRSSAPTWARSTPPGSPKAADEAFTAGYESKGMNATNGSTLLKVKGLETGYGDVQILWGIDVEVHQGEIVAVIGSNGAGKTTFLKTLSGILKPTAGSITFDGEAVDRARSEEIVERGIAHVPEGRRLFPAMSLEENLLMGAYARKMPAQGSAGRPGSGV